MSAPSWPDLGETFPGGDWMLKLPGATESVQVYEFEGRPTLYVSDRLDSDAAVPLTGEQCRAVAAALLRAAAGGLS